jgi:hypothetical protein
VTARDTLKPNGRTRYTMLGEKQGGQFSTTLCPTQTEGELKSIVFTNADKRKNTIDIGDAQQGGVQIHAFGGNRSESNMQGVTINPTTLREMNEIHAKCVGLESGEAPAAEIRRDQRAAGEKHGANREHHQAGRNPPEHPPHEPKEDHREPPSGEQQGDNQPHYEAEGFFDRARSFVGHANLCARRRWK